MRKQINWRRKIIYAGFTVAFLISPDRIQEKYFSKSPTSVETKPSSNPSEDLEASAKEELTRRDYLNSRPNYQERNYAIINGKTFELANRK